MRSLAYRSTVWHARHEGAEHSFIYPTLVFGLDLAELPALNRLSPLLCFDRFGVFSFWRRDYLRAFNGSWLDKVRDALGGEPPHRVVAITAPRYFGYVFNPVNFYVCYESPEKISALLAEVQNTFGEAQVYAMRQSEPSATDSAGPFAFPKRFYVSPFFDVGGEYRLTLHELGERLDISVDLLRGGETIFRSRLRGDAVALSRRSLLRLWFAYPLNGWLTLWRIEWEALKLFFMRRLTPLYKPAPPCGAGAFASPRWSHRLRLALLAGLIALRRFVFFNERKI